MSRRIYDNGSLVEEWDDSTLAYRRYASGRLVEERTYTAAELAAVAVPDGPAPSFVQTAKRALSLRDATGIDWTGRTNSATAVQNFITSAGAGATIDIDQRDGIIRCDSTLTLQAFQHLRGGSSKQGGGPTAATFNYANMPAAGTAIDASAGSCTISDVHLTGPGSSNTSSKGIYTSGAGGSAITLNRVTSQRFGDGVNLANQYYASLTDVEVIYNRVGLRLTGCYNVNLYRPRFFCGGTDGIKGSGIITNTVRSLNVFGGSIEGYGSIIDAAGRAGIAVGSGSLVSVWGTYFETPGSTGNCIAIDVTTATDYQLNVFGCPVYLGEHRAFIDAEGTSSRGTINAGGNQFYCSASTTPAAPIVYFLGTNAGLSVNVGISQPDSMHGVTLAGVTYIDNQGTATAKQNVHVPHELLSGTGQGGVFFGDPIRTTPATAARSGFRIPHGTAPTTPANGDMWSTTAGLFVRINGATVGPLT